MKKPITRRDFLRLAGLFPLSIAAPGLVNALPPVQSTDKPQNILIVVFDAFSAYNISLYGYPRETTPNLARLVERAIIYHRHYAGGNFTTPGTASILTGTLPWTHRAFGLGKNQVERPFVEKNLFSAFEGYYRQSYTHNPVANKILTQFDGTTDEHIPLGRLFLTSDSSIETLFGKDEDIASVSWVRAIKNNEEGFAYSLFLSHLYREFRKKKVEALASQFPRGIPYIAGDNYFLLEDAIGWLQDNLGIVPQPFIGYFHFLPPHRPYNTRRDFYNLFRQDGYLPEQKPISAFSNHNEDYATFLLKRRREYDEYILYVDKEFGSLFDALENSGLLENTWVVLTSDHGEMFERGILGHITPVLYEPVIRVPLIIFEPGRTRRLDIHTPTSAVDVLPTLLHLTGGSPANWSEGSLLPPYTDYAITKSRDIFVVEAKKNDRQAPLTIATIALIKEGYKLMYFLGYDELGGEEHIEFYDVEADPEETNDLSNSKRETASEMLHKLKGKLAEVNEPYQ